MKKTNHSIDPKFKDLYPKEVPVRTYLLVGIELVVGFIVSFAAGAACECWLHMSNDNASIVSVMVFGLAFFLIYFANRKTGIFHLP